MSIYSKILIFFICFSFVTPTFGEAPDPVRGKSGMVVSASELASKVGLSILQKGGNAVDAAIAVGFALAVTYPSAGNLGGGGFMVIHLKSGKDITIDYREKAPLSANKDMFLDDKGNVIEKMSSDDVTSSGVPGSVAGLIYILEKYGTMKLKDVIQPAINLAEDGFQLNYSLAESFKLNLNEFKKYPSSVKIFSKNGIPYKEGEIFKQKDLANTLKLIRDKGVEGFYKGTVADLIVKQIKANKGFITLKDLEDYNVIEREPVTGNYKGYKIVSMGPPSSGGIALIQLLNIIGNYNFNKYDWNSSSYVHRLVQAMKFVYADRSKHLGDPDFYKVPVNNLLSKNYSENIFKKINDEKDIPSAEIFPHDFTKSESKETTHYSIADAEGNAVSTTTTINSSYGSKVVVEGAGFLLNNEMDDFSVKPGVPNQFGLIGSEANSIQPRKRMLSSMTPAILLKDNKPFMIIGSPGGSTIITTVLQVILNVVDFDMDIQEAINAPRFHHQWLPDELVYEPFGLSLDVINSLKAKGYQNFNISKLGMAEGILINQKDGIITGASDPRGNGSAEGF